jgi:hypothetical protein
VHSYWFAEAARLIPPFRGVPAGVSSSVKLLYALCAFPSRCTWHLDEWHTLRALPCYSLSMDPRPPLPTPESLAEHLIGTPGSKERFGRTATAVLETAALVAAADADWDKDTVLAFQKAQEIHQKVWGKLIAIHRDRRLVPLQECLPASYTALYALVVMSEEELAAALKEEVVSAHASSRSILDWTKAYRLRGTGIEQEIPLTLVLRVDLTKERQKDLLEALQRVADQFGADVLEGKGGVKQAGLKAEARKALASEIEEELMRLSGPVVVSAPEDLKNRFGVSSAADLIEAPRQTFTGFFQNLEGKVEGAFWKHHGRAYCLRIARDYNLTDSRAERYQFKKRIDDAIEKWGGTIDGFQAMAEGILKTYMAR